jgi:hypothetical protein
VAKKVSKTEYVKHPYTKKKLRVIDTFTPSKDTKCPGCEEGDVQEIRVVESEYRGGVRYNIVTCTSCDAPVWVVLN